MRRRRPPPYVWRTGLVVVAGFAAIIVGVRKLERGADPPSATGASPPPAARASPPSRGSRGPRTVAGGAARMFGDDVAENVPDCAHRDDAGRWAPAPGYPKTSPVSELIANWNPDDMAHLPARVYRGICRFDAATEWDKALAYRAAEVPFQLTNFAALDATVERWANASFLEQMLGATTEYASEASRPGGSSNHGPNHFMYSQGRGDANWSAPIEKVQLTFPQWRAAQARVPRGAPASADFERLYFRFSARDAKRPRDAWLYRELPWFAPPPDGARTLFLAEPRQARGIHCRFGMSGLVSEAHWDGSNNMIVQLGGRRRYILVDPSPSGACDMYLHPLGHPSARQSRVDWSRPESWLPEFPRFASMPAHEIVQEPGDALYLPTFYLHFVNSVDTNYQCNARAGREMTRAADTYACTPGFEKQAADIADDGKKAGSRRGDRRGSRPRRSGQS